MQKLESQHAAVNMLRGIVEPIDEQSMRDLWDNLKRLEVVPDIRGTTAYIA